MHYANDYDFRIKQKAQQSEKFIAVLSNFLATYSQLTDGSYLTHKISYDSVHCGNSCIQGIYLILR